MPDPSTSPPADDTVESLIAECLDRLPAEGESVVDRICAAHPDHADEIRASLQSLRDAGLVEDATGDVAVPAQLGPFRIKERLGAGGMGVVYVAEQEPLGREVALKLLRPEQLFFPGARLRFRREIEAVAKLQHPGIVPIYTVGEAHGVPYFAMERIDGASLADVILALRGRAPGDLTAVDLRDAIHRCAGRDPASPTADDRAETTGDAFDGTYVEACVRLIRQVAYALEHAHARGIVHRDVKPSNILVTRSGRALLCDFGVARSAGASKVTATGTTIGSLAYMAPEQVRGEHGALDHRADVYALGASLYELLALREPFRADSREALRQAILDGVSPPLRPQNRAVSWDVDTAVVTAMAPEPTRRYATAFEFGRDLDNVLAHRPIQARRPGLALRFRRFAQRNPATTIGALAAVLLFVVAPIVFAWREYRARIVISGEKAAAEDARDLARDRERTARAVSRFVVELFEAASPDTARGRETPARELVDRGARKIEALQNEPPVYSKLSWVIGSVLHSLGDYEASLRHLKVGLDVGIEAFGEASGDVAMVHAELGGVHLSKQDGPAAVRALRAALAADDASPPDLRVPRASRATFMIDLGTALGLSNAVDEGRRWIRRGLDILAGETHYPQSVLLGWNALSALEQSAQNYVAALEASERAHRMATKLYRPDSPRLARVLINHGLALRMNNRLDEAAEMYRIAIPALENAMGAEHDDVGIALMNHGVLHHALARQEGLSAADVKRHQHRARVLLERAARILKATLGEKTQATGTCLATLARMAHDGRDFRRAAALYTRALPGQMIGFGERSLHVANSRAYLANALLHLGELERAEASFDAALKTYEALGRRDAEIFEWASRFGLAVVREETKARRWLRIALEAAERMHEEDDLSMVRVLFTLGGFSIGRGEFERAERYLRRALALYEKFFPRATHPGVLGREHCASLLAGTLAELKRFEEAESLQRTALETVKAAQGEKHRDTILMQSRLVHLYERWGPPKRKVFLAERAILFDLAPGIERQWRARESTPTASQPKKPESPR